MMRQAALFSKTCPTCRFNNGRYCTAVELLPTYREREVIFHWARTNSIFNGALKKTADNCPGWKPTN